MFTAAEEGEGLIDGGGGTPLDDLDMDGVRDGIPLVRIMLLAVGFRSALLDACATVGSPSRRSQGS